jgi:hypothetical protein
MEDKTNGVSEKMISDSDHHNNDEKSGNGVHSMIVERSDNNNGNNVADTMIRKQNGVQCTM